MRLYLVRHGQAQPSDVDPRRGLTPRGRADARRVAEFLKPLDLTVADLWHSGKPRAQQTAEILATALTVAGEVAEREGLAPLDPIDDALADVSRRDDDLMIVGHMPFQARLASALLAGAAGGAFVGFVTVAVACLDRDDHGTWRLLWMICPELIP